MATVHEISPEKHNVESTFSGTSYFIDFYQREYKWGREEVITLLNDVFYKFELEYPAHTSLEPTAANVEQVFPWYYLSTYITNRSDGRTYLVDGQQRLTTLTLVLIKLYHLFQVHGVDEGRTTWLKRRIVDYSADGETFWIGQGLRKPVLKALFEGRELL